MGSEYEDLYVEENEKSRIDFVNLLYVATTRASERLHILCGQPSKETANVKSVTDILVEFLKLEGKWTEGNFVYEYGTLVQRSSGEKSGPSHRIAPKTLVSQSWQERILMRLQAPGHWDVTDPDHAREWGMLIHTLLAGVSTREDIRRKLDELRSQGIVADKYRDRIEAVLEKILKHPDLVALFDEAGRVVNEAEILTASGDAYRPDRVTIGENGVTVIDYKTGKPMPGHSEQLRHYMHLLGELGYDKVNGYLVYIGQDLTVEAV
jgi:ATP-dependent exoDNAse (exonuclease V) beta subunit